MGKYTFLALFIITLLGVSCIKEKSDDGTCLNELSLVYDWSHGERIQPTDSLIIKTPDGSFSYVRTNNTGTKLRRIPGIYTLIAYEATSTASTVGMNHTIAVDSQGYAISPAPFSSGFTVFVVGNDRIEIYTLPMYRQTRELIIKVNCQGLGVATLTSITGWIDGITVSRSLTEGFTPLDGISRHGAIIGGKTKYDFSLTDLSDESTRRFSGTKRLLGIDGPVDQTLHLTLHYTGGDREITANVTHTLDNFHTVNVNEPFVIEITISVSEDFSADIVDWQWGSLSEMEAH